MRRTRKVTVQTVGTHRVWVKKKLYKVGKKAKSPRKDHAWAYMAGVIAMLPHSYLHLDAEENWDNDTLCVASEAAVTPLMLDPDEYTGKILDYEALSEEARYVVGLVLETPGEALEWITTPIHQRITKSRVGEYLQRVLGWPPKTVQQTFLELADYTKGLGP